MRDLEWSCQDDEDTIPADAEMEIERVSVGRKHPSPNRVG